MKRIPNSKASRCVACNQDMSIAASCTLKSVHYTTGIKLPAIPFKAMKSMSKVTNICNDCGIENGGYHHPGCDQAICPNCNGQLLACDCGAMRQIERRV